MKFLFLTIIILSLACTSCAKTDYANVLVTKVFDGDTLRLANGEKVRLIGIDTPENEYSYKEATYLNQGKKWERSPGYYEQARKATEFTRELVEGKEVRLEFDVEKRDKYGRLLAYVFIDYPPYVEFEQIEGWHYGRNAESMYVFVNATIVKSGYAQPMTIPPNVKYADLFQKLYQEAQENKRGMWSND